VACARTIKGSAAACAVTCANPAIGSDTAPPKNVPAIKSRFNGRIGFPFSANRRGEQIW
jgi:hypothetical protein